MRSTIHLIIAAYVALIGMLSGIIVITLYLDASSYISRQAIESVLIMAGDGLKISLGAALGALSVLISKAKTDSYSRSRVPRNGDQT